MVVNLREVKSAARSMETALELRELKAQHAELFYGLRQHYYQALFGGYHIVAAPSWEVENPNPSACRFVVAVQKGNGRLFWNGDTKTFSALPRSAKIYADYAQVLRIVAALKQKGDRPIILGAVDRLQKQQFQTDTAKSYKKQFIAEHKEALAKGHSVFCAMESPHEFDWCRFQEELTDEDGNSSKGRISYTDEFWEWFNQKVWRPHQNEVMAEFDATFGVGGFIIEVPFEPWSNLCCPELGGRFTADDVPGKIFQVESLHGKYRLSVNFTGYHAFESGSAIAFQIATQAQTVRVRGRVMRLNPKAAYLRQMNAIVQYALESCAKTVDEFGAAVFDPAWVDESIDESPEQQVRQKLRQINAEAQEQRKLNDLVMRGKTLVQTGELPPDQQRPVPVNMTEVPGDGHGKTLSNEEMAAQQSAIAGEPTVDASAVLDRLKTLPQWSQLKGTVTRTWNRMGAKPILDAEGSPTGQYEQLTPAAMQQVLARIEASASYLNLVKADEDATTELVNRLVYDHLACLVQSLQAAIASTAEVNPATPMAQAFQKAAEAAAGFGMAS